MRKELEEAVRLLHTVPPEAYAFLYGSSAYPSLTGAVYFYPLWGGTLLVAEVSGLPVRKALRGAKLWISYP